MKNKLKKIVTSFIVIFTLLTCFSLNLINVSAAAVNITSIEATGYTHRGEACSGFYCAQFYGQSIDRLHLSDGKVGFCIEPSKLVTQMTGYISVNQYNTTYSKIIYHGYLNTGQTLYDYAVTQLMIWEVLGYYPTSHTVSNYATRKAQIQSLVNSHDIKPSFNGNSYTLNIGESLTLTDTNNVLSQFSNLNAEGCNIKVSGNQLTITPIVSVPNTVTISGRKYLERNLGASYVYTNGSSQQIYSGMLSDPVFLNINLKVTSGRVKFNKTGEVFTHTLTGSTHAGTYQEPMWETQKLLGAEITICAAEEIKDHSNNVLYTKDEVVDVVESTYDDDYSDLLPEGKYYWYESKVPFGYIEDLSKHYFEITAHGGSNQIINANLYNDRAEQLLVFSKTMELHDIEKYQNDEAYKDVVFGVFTRDDTYNYRGDVAIPYDTMVAQFIIDSEGNAKSNVTWNDINLDGIEQDDELTYTDLKLNLPVGNYYVKELKTNSAYQLDKKEYDFSVDYQGSSMHNITLIINDGEIINTLKDYQIQVNKVDLYTNKVIKSNDFEFALFADKECTEVVQTVNANKENGTALFKNIHNGQYWIKEIKAPVGYLLSDEIVKLDINENGVFINDRQIQSENDIYSFVYANEMIPMVETGDTTNVNMFKGLFLLSGLTFSAILFRKKEKLR